jgi:hypothetical protein
VGDDGFESVSFVVEDDEGALRVLIYNPGVCVEHDFVVLVLRKRGCKPPQSTGKVQDPRGSLDEAGLRGM